MNAQEAKVAPQSTAEALVERYGLYLVIGLAFFARAFMAWNRDMYSPDSALYIAAAYHYAKGETARAMAIYPMPTLSLLLALSHSLFDNWKIAALPFTMVPSVLICIPVYRITSDLFGRRAALWGGCALALDPYLVKYGVQILRDPMFLCLFTWGVEAAYRFQKNPKWPDMVRALLMVGTALLFRIDGLFFFPLWALFLVTRAITAGENRVRYRLGACIWTGAAPAAAFGVAILFPSRWPTLTQGSFVADKIHGLVTLQFLDGYQRIYKALVAFHSIGSPLSGGIFLEAVRHYLPLLYLIVLIEYYIRMVFPSNALLFAVGFRLRRDWGQVLLLASTACFMFVTYLFIVQQNWIAKRYLALVVPLVLPWVGRGMVRLERALSGTAWKKMMHVTLVCLFFAWPAAKIVDLAYQRKDPSLRLAGHWIAAQHRFRKAKIFSADNRILLYSGRYADIPAWKQHGRWKNQLRKRTGSRKKILVVIDPDSSNHGDLPSDLDAFLPIKVFQGPVYRVTVVTRNEGHSG